VAFVDGLGEGLFAVDILATWQAWIAMMECQWSGAAMMTASMSLSSSTWR
jgi:hypothetical protein